MTNNETYTDYRDSIEHGTFLGKYSELTYMLHMMESTGRLSSGQCEQLLRLARGRDEERADGGAARGPAIG